MSFVSRSSSRTAQACHQGMHACHAPERAPAEGAMLSCPGCACRSQATLATAPAPPLLCLRPAAGGWWPAIISDFNPKKAKHQLTCESWGDPGGTPLLLFLVIPASCAWPSAFDPNAGSCSGSVTSPCALHPADNAGQEDESFEWIDLGKLGNDKIRCGQCSGLLHAFGDPGLLGSPRGSRS